MRCKALGTRPASASLREAVIGVNSAWLDINIALIDFRLEECQFGVSRRILYIDVPSPWGAVGRTYRGPHAL
jgi:hypothetical protein